VNGSSEEKAFSLIGRDKLPLPDQHCFCKRSVCRSKLVLEDMTDPQTEALHPDCRGSPAGAMQPLEGLRRGAPELKDLPLPSHPLRPSHAWIQAASSPTGKSKNTNPIPTTDVQDVSRHQQGPLPTRTCPAVSIPDPMNLQVHA
jgi:hypothetical protein